MRIVLSLLILLVLGLSGCKAFRETFNEPEREQRSSSRGSSVFSFSSEASRPEPSMNDHLTPQEQALLKQYRRDSYVAPNDKLGETPRDKRNWVFGY